MMVYLYAVFLKNYQDLGCLSVPPRAQSSYSICWKVCEDSKKTRRPLRFPSTIISLLGSYSTDSVVQYRMEVLKPQMFFVLRHQLNLGCLSVTSRPQSSYSTGWKICEYSKKTRRPLRFTLGVLQSGQEAQVQYSTEWKF